MTPLVALQAKAVPLMRDNVDTDAIIPSREMKSVSKTGLADGLFAGWRYVIASDTGGLADIVDHGRNGILVPPGDPHALADAIRALAADPALRARLREGARATANGKLNWDRIAAELHEVLSG